MKDWRNGILIIFGILTIAAVLVYLENHGINYYYIAAGFIGVVLLITGVAIILRKQAVWYGLKPYGLLLSPIALAGYLARNSKKGKKISGRQSFVLGLIYFLIGTILIWLATKYFLSLNY